MRSGSFMESRFLADSMLGKLAKWLRVMGFDTHYQPFYREGEIGELVQEGRCLISRHRGTIDPYPNSVWIRSDRVKDQLHEMRNRGNFPLERSKWFTRCLICNVPLKEAKTQHFRDNVPEYVFYQHTTGIRVCPCCGRHFWPGTHRERMVKQLERWGF